MSPTGGVKRHFADRATESRAKDPYGAAEYEKRSQVGKRGRDKSSGITAASVPGDELLRRPLAAEGRTVPDAWEHMQWRGLREVSCVDTMISKIHPQKNLDQMIRR